jgi:hypothetical protein
MPVVAAVPVAGVVPAALPTTASGRLETPRRIRIGGDERTVTTPLEMLIATAEWLVEHGRLSAAATPFVAGPNRYLVHREPRHRDRAMVQPHRLSNGLFLEAHHSPASCITHARKLLVVLAPEATLEVL